MEITKGDNVHAESEIHFAIYGVGPPGAADHALAPGQHCPSVAAHHVHKGWAWSITCPCDCKVCPLCISVCLLALLTNWTKFARNSDEFRTTFERMNVWAGV